MNKFKFKIPQQSKPKFKIRPGVALTIKEVPANNEINKDIDTVSGDFVLFTEKPETKPLELFDIPDDIMNIFTKEMEAK